MIINHLISTHGQQCSACAYSQHSGVFDLPSNFVVVMNCEPSPIISSTQIDAKVWELATNKDLLGKLSGILTYKENVNIKDIQNVLNEYFSYIKTLLNNRDNRYCMYFDTCPNMQVMREDKIFKSGVYTLPVEITTNLPHKKILTHQDFKDFSKAPYRGATDPIVNFLAPTYIDQSKYKIVTYGIKQDHSDLSYHGTQNNTLQQYVNYINHKTNGTGFHVIFFVACACGKTDPSRFRSELTNSKEKFLYKLMSYFLTHINNNLCTLSLDLINEKILDNSDSNIIEWRNKFESAVESTTCKNAKKTTTNTGTNTNASTNASTNTNSFPNSNTKANVMTYDNDEPPSLTLKTVATNAKKDIEFPRKDIRIWLEYIGYVIAEINKTSHNEFKLIIQDNDSDKNTKVTIKEDGKQEESIILYWKDNFNFDIKYNLFAKYETNKFFTYNKTNDTYSVTVTLAPMQTTNAQPTTVISISSSVLEDKNQINRRKFQFSKDQTESFVSAIENAVEGTKFKTHILRENGIFLNLEEGETILDFIRFYKSSHADAYYVISPGNKGVSYFIVTEEDNTLTITLNTDKMQQGGFILHKNKVYVAQGKKKFLVKLDKHQQPFIHVKANKVLLTNIMRLKQQDEKHQNKKCQKLQK
jgi:hypothetical protein